MFCGSDIKQSANYAVSKAPKTVIMVIGVHVRLFKKKSDDSFSGSTQGKKNSICSSPVYIQNHSET
jgi:hypothetical protein